MSVSNEGEGTLNWTAAIPATVTWARISSGGNGSNSGTISVAVDANTGDAREFDLTVSADGAASRNVTISQPAAPQEIEITAASTELDGEGGSVTLQVRNSGSGTLEWSASLGGDVDWAYIESGESGTDAGEIVVRYALNGGEDRELDVAVSAVSASNSPQSLALSQQWFGAGTCTYPEARGEVLELLREVYYFNDEPEQQAKYEGLNVDEFSTLDALLAEIQWMPETHDRGFTYWLTARESEMLFNARAFLFGFRMVVIINDSQQPQYLEMLDVYDGSPAGDAGLSRGDKILALNGKAVDSLTIQQLQIELGPNEEGYEVEVEVEMLDGATRTFTMAKREVEIPTVPEEHVAVFNTGVGPVGYLHFRTFFGDANERLLEEFAGFKSRGVQNLIVDLRYNGGGSVPIAHGLATLIGGPELFEDGKQTVLARTIHNDLLASFGWNETTFFSCRVYGPADQGQCENESSLRGLENVVFITSEGSASASELVITALQPHENVSLIGKRTYGKPVGQYGFDFCRSDPDERFSGVATLWPVSFATVNSEGFEEYYDGLPVTQGCEASDDLSSPLGDANEGRIATALRLIETGSCAASTSAGTAAPTGSMQAMPPRGPIDQFLGR